MSGVEGIPRQERRRECLWRAPVELVAKRPVICAGVSASRATFSSATMQEDKYLHTGQWLQFAWPETHSQRRSGHRCRLDKSDINKYTC